MSHLYLTLLFVAVFSYGLAALIAWRAREGFWPFAGIFTATGVAGLFFGHLQFALAHPDAEYVGFQFPLGLAAVFLVLMSVRSIWPRYGWVCDAAGVALGPLIAGARAMCYRTGCCVEVRDLYVLIGVLLTVYAANWWHKREGDGRYAVRAVLAFFLVAAAIEYHYQRDPLLVPVALLGAVLAAIFVR